LLRRLLSGSFNVSFGDMINLVEGFAFRLSRTRGSRHIYTHPEIPELVHLQEVGGQAKPYHVRQFLRLEERYNPRLQDEE
jgi:predicted RNA binding protein YcfA (HicA-like mRNA interferase family)